MASGGDGAGFQVRQFKSALSVGLGCRRQESGGFMSSELNPSEFPNDSSRLDLLSSSMDDELGLDDADQMLAIWRQDAGARAAWHAYHLIGDVLVQVCCVKLGVNCVVKHALDVSGDDHCWCHDRPLFAIDFD